jgi:hypothetical protein
VGEVGDVVVGVDVGEGEIVGLDVAVGVGLAVDTATAANVGVGISEYRHAMKIIGINNKSILPGSLLIMATPIFEQVAC